MKLTERRKAAKERLEKQLVSGMKPNKFGTTKEKKANPYIPLLSTDEQRIKKEIAILQSKI